MTKADLDPAEIKNLLPGYGAAEVERLIKATRPSSVTRQWGRLSSIFTANLGVEYFGASDEAIAAAEASMGRWPAELRELYRCVERADHRRGMLLLPPQFELLSVAQVEKRHEFWAEATRNPAFGSPVDVEAEMAKPAGTAVGAMLPGFIPFANDDADTLFVDARSGPFHGCVNLWPDADVARLPPIWRSLSAMLEDLAFALERNTTMSMRLSGWNRYQPYVEGDRLVWEALP